MPVTKSAQKKLRQDKRKTLQNKNLENLFKKMVKEAKKNPRVENIKKAVSAVDKSAKKNIIHRNKAASIKSTLYKLLGVKSKLPKTKLPRTLSQKKASEQPQNLNL